MGVTTTRKIIGSPPVTTDRRAIAVADANWFTTENLFREVPAALADTLLLKCIDYNNAWRRGAPPWDWGRPLSLQAPSRWQREHVLPTGWMKRFPRIGMRPISHSILRWRASHAPDSRLTLVMTYPHYLFLRDQVKPDRHVYFNLDDYAQYWPRAAVVVKALERQAVRESHLTVCVSRLRAEELKAAVPEAAHKVRHLPHGSPSNSIAPRPLDQPLDAPSLIAQLPRPLLGYIGTLEDRVDWSLLTRLAQRYPRASVVLVGRLGKGTASGWRSDRERCLSLPNVTRLDWQPQESIHTFNQAFDVCLIPYQVEHAFNQACCPTKIMDYMATGRPIVSTALPECKLYRGLFDVVDSTDEFLDAVGRIVAQNSDDGRASARHEWAKENTCRRVVERFLSWIPK